MVPSAARKRKFTRLDADGRPAGPIAQHEGPMGGRLTGSLPLREAHPGGETGHAAVLVEHNGRSLRRLNRSMEPAVARHRRATFGGTGGDLESLRLLVGERRIRRALWQAPHVVEKVTQHIGAIAD